MANNLRYYALGGYVGIVALWTALDKIALTAENGIAMLAPLAVVIGADYLKHRKDNEPPEAATTKSKKT